MDFATRVPGVAPLRISTYSMYAPYSQVMQAINGQQQLTWTANLACYIPIVVPGPFLLNRWMLQRSTNTQTENVDLGIYSADDSSLGRRLASLGSTSVVMPGTGSSISYFNATTPLLLTPGRYFLGFSTSGTIMAGMGSLGLTSARAMMLGILFQIATFPLPATMGGGTTTNQLYPYIGICQDT